MCFFLITVSVFAEDLYVVRDIAVDAGGENAIEAKDNALTRARRNGFETMLKRLGVDASFASVSDRSIATMVNSFEINREKSSKNRYLASVNVMFNKNAVQAYVGRNTNLAVNNDVLSNSGHNNDRFTPARNMQQSKHLSLYKAEVKINNLSHFVNLKNNMTSIPMLDKILLSSIKSNRAIVEIQYDGDVESLKTGLMRRGLQLLPNRTGNMGVVPYVLAAYR